MPPIAMLRSRARPNVSSRFFWAAVHRPLHQSPGPTTSMIAEPAGAARSRRIGVLGAGSVVFAWRDATTFGAASATALTSSVQTTSAVPNGEATADANGQRMPSVSSSGPEVSIFVGASAMVREAMALDDDARSELAALEAAGRLRTPRTIDGATGPVCTVDGVVLDNFSSNDYLSLAADPRLARAAAGAMEREGFGAGASRLITGSLASHAALEREVADWMRCSGVRVFNTGYAANVGVLTSLAGSSDRIFSDELNHASIIDGCRLSRARVDVYPHRDLGALEALLSSSERGRRRIIVTESLFSMDGDIADLAALHSLARRHAAALVVDEAHAIGAHGEEGRGLCATAGVEPDVLVGTFGKSLGTFGAFAATTRAIADLLWNRARPFVFSTALPPAIPAATRASIEIVRGSEGTERRRTLARHARMIRELVPFAGGAIDSAIAPILVGDDRATMALSSTLLAERVLVQGIRPPTVPTGTSRLRLSLAAGHTVQQLERAGRLLVNALRQSR